MGWSTRAFAEHAGVDLSTLYDIEHAVYRSISLDTLTKLAKGLGVHPKCLIARLPRKRPPFPEQPLQIGIASSLLRWRAARGWSQVQLAKEARVSRAALADIERQVRNPTLAVLERIASALERTLPDLLSGN